MKLHIQNNLRIKDLQNEFQKYYPNLKLEFFTQPHYVGRGTAHKYLINSSQIIGSCRKTKKEGEVTVNNSKKVFVLENELSTKYDLYAQVFRKSGRVWLETTATDYWTLAEQNQEGSEIAPQNTLNNS